VDVPDIQRGRAPEGLEPEAVPRMLAAELKREVELGQTVSLLVSLAVPDLAEGKGPRFDLPPGAAVDVHLRRLQGFELDGPRDLRLVVTDEPETLPVQFRLRAVTPGEGCVEVLAFHRGDCLGRLVVVSAVTQAPATKIRPARYELELHPGGTRNPDLALLIQEVGDRHAPALLVRVWSAESPDVVEEFGPIPLLLHPSRYFADFFRDLEGLSSKDERSRAMAVDRLERKGAKLFQSLFPEDLQELLWSWRGRIRSLRVESEESWIPWELCRLVGREGGQIEESGFFCEDFVMGRWILGVRHKPALQLRRIGVIAPEGSDLRGAEEERRHLLGLDDERLQVQPISCRRKDVLSALASGVFDGIHFAGHGSYRDPDPDRSWILLDEGEELRPDDLSGKVGNLGKTWPLAFLNACQTGRSSFSLTHLGGWAPTFLVAGAGAFLGALWEVSDKGAEIFARSFYRELLAGQPIGEAVRRARKTARTELPGNPAWLAYTLFADPLAQVMVPSK
jgi:hypothetical protein